MTVSLENLTHSQMRSNVIDAVCELNIPKEEIIVVGGAALQVYGIKVSPDIDLVTRPDRFRDILKNVDHFARNLTLGHIGINAAVTDKFSGQKLHDEGYGVILGNVTFTLAPDDDLYQASFEELHDEAVEIEDLILVSPPQRILDWKKAIHRPKDMKDIDLIEQYLENFRRIV